MDFGSQTTPVERREHQSDGFIWSALRYLDSPTAYREYLPQAGPLLRLSDTQFVILDNERLPLAKLWVISAVIAAVSIAVLVCLRIVQ